MALNICYPKQFILKYFEYLKYLKSALLLISYYTKWKNEILQSFEQTTVNTFECIIVENILMSLQTYFNLGHVHTCNDLSTKRKYS